MNALIEVSKFSGVLKMFKFTSIRETKLRNHTFIYDNIKYDDEVSTMNCDLDSI